MNKQYALYIIILLLLIITVKAEIISSITTTPGRQTMNFDTSIFDVNLTSCKYTIYNSTGGIDGLNNNVSFTCNQVTSATVTQYGFFVLIVSFTDNLNNTNFSTKEFLTIPGYVEENDIEPISLAIDNSAELQNKNLTFNLDTAIRNCFGEDKEKCIWNKSEYKYFGLIMAIFLTIFIIAKFESKKTKSQIPVHTYAIKLKTK